MIGLLKHGIFVTTEIPIPKIHIIMIVGQRSSIRRQRQSTMRVILRLGIGNVDRRAHLDETEKLRREILVHPDAPVSRRLVFHPARMESVIRLEFAPIRHRSASEGPANRTRIQHRAHRLTVLEGKSMRVRTFFVNLVEYSEITHRSRALRGPHRYRHRKQNLGVLNHIDTLLAEGNFDFHTIRIFGQRSRQIVSVVGGDVLPRIGCGTRSSPNQEDRRNQKHTQHPHESIVSKHGVKHVATRGNCKKAITRRAIAHPRAFDLACT